MTKKTTVLEKLKITEVSLVDKGANTGARVLITKRATPSDAVDFNESMALEEAQRKVSEAMSKFWDAFYALQRSLESILSDAKADKGALTQESLQQFSDHIADLMPDLAVAKALSASINQLLGTENMNIQELTKALETAESEINKLKAENETLRKGAADNASPEDLLKSLDPGIRRFVEDLQKRADQSDATIAKMVDERDTAEHVAKAASLEYLGIDAKEFGPVLKKIPADVRGKVWDVLAAANSLVHESTLFNEFGKRAGDVSVSESPIVKAARAQAAAAKAA